MTRSRDDDASYVEPSITVTRLLDLVRTLMLRAFYKLNV
jgi:hypothetical protein